MYMLAQAAWGQKLAQTELPFAPGTLKLHSLDRKPRPVLARPYNWGRVAFAGPMAVHSRCSKYRRVHMVCCSLDSVVLLVLEQMAHVMVRIAVLVANTVEVPIVVEAEASPVLELAQSVHPVAAAAPIHPQRSVLDWRGLPGVSLPHLL